MPCAHKLEFLVRSPFGQPFYGLVVLGIPDDQYRQLKTEFPDGQFSGQDPRVNEAIKAGVTEAEKQRIMAELGFDPRIQFELQFQTITRYVDEEKEKPAFEMNGKKFWTFSLS